MFPEQNGLTPVAPSQGIALPDYSRVRGDQMQMYAGSTPPPPVGAAPGFVAPYAAQLGSMILDDQLPHDYQPYWFQQQPTFRTPELFGPSAAQRARQLAFAAGQQASSMQQAQAGGGPFNDFPDRISLPFPWSGGQVNPATPLDDSMQQYLGPGTMLGTALGQPGTGYGGAIPGTAIANTPLTLANFSAWGRERLLALIDSALTGGNYVTPATATFGMDNEGPQQKGPLDTLVDIFKVPFDVIANVFDGVSQWWNDSQAQVRGVAVRELAQSGQATTGWIDVITSAVTGGADKFNSDAIRAKAAQTGVDYVSMVAQYYDFDPNIVAQIMANPQMGDDELAALVKGQPLSQNPVVNMSLEFAKQLAMFAVPIAAEGRLAALGVRGLEAAGLGAEALAGGSTAARVAQGAGWAARTAFKVNSLNTAVGWTIGGAEWGLKQAALLGGNQQVVDLMDKLMWNMPLSMNPGVNIVTAFSSHPLEALGIHVGRTGIGRAESGLLKGSVEIGTPGTIGYVGRVAMEDGRPVLTRPPQIIDLPGASAKYPVVQVGDRFVRLNKDGSEIVHAIESMQTLDDFQPLFDRLGWNRDMIQGGFGPGNANNLTLDDLKEALLYTSLSAVRSAKGPLASLHGISEMSVTDRALRFMADNIGEAHQLFRDSIKGNSDALVDEFKGQWWRFADLNDTNQALVKARLQTEYVPYNAFVDFLSWVKVSKIHREAYSAGLVGLDTAIRLRESLNRPYVEQFRASIVKKYEGGAIVPAAEVDLLKRYGGMIEKRGRGSELIRTGKKFKPMSRDRLVEIIDSALADDATLRAEEAALPREHITAVGKGRDIADPIEEARVLHVGTADMEVVRAAEALPPEQLATLAIPRNVLREVAKWAHKTPDELMADPSTGWQLTFDWLNEKTAQAVDTAKQRDALDGFVGALREQRAVDPAYIDEALKGAEYTRDYLLNPVQSSYLKPSDPLALRLSQTRSAFDKLWPDMQRLSADPSRKTVIVDFTPDGFARYAWPESLPQGWAADLLKVIRDAKAGEGDTALLADPAVHPLLKLEELARADLTDAQRDVLNRFLTDENQRALQGLVDRVLGPGKEADAANALRLVDAFDAWQTKTANAGAELAAIGARFRAIEQGGSHTPEMLDLYDRLTDHEARSGQPWRSISVRTYDRPLPSTEERIDYIKRDKAASRLSTVQADLVSAQKELDVLQAHNVEPDFENPVRTFTVRKGGAKGANVVAREYARDSGLPAMVRPVRKPSGGVDHYEVVIGNVKPREQAIEDAMQAGRVEESQALNVAEGIARGGTAESGGATVPSPRDRWTPVGGGSFELRREDGTVAAHIVRDVPSGDYFLSIGKSTIDEKFASVDDAIAAYDRAEGLAAPAPEAAALPSVPDYVTEEIARRADAADKMGATPAIIDLARQRYSAGEIADQLMPRAKEAGYTGTLSDLKAIVRGVRAREGIPSLEEASDFEAWRTSSARQAVDQIFQTVGRVTGGNDWRANKKALGRWIDTMLANPEEHGDAAVAMANALRPYLSRWKDARYGLPTGDERANLLQSVVDDVLARSAREPALEKFSLTKSYQGAPAGTLVEKIGEPFNQGKSKLIYQQVRLPDGTQTAVRVSELNGPIARVEQGGQVTYEAATAPETALPASIAPDAERDAVIAKYTDNGALTPSTVEQAAGDLQERGYDVSQVQDTYAEIKDLEMQQAELEKVKGKARDRAQIDALTQQQADLWQRMGDEIQQVQKVPEEQLAQHMADSGMFDGRPLSPEVQARLDAADAKAEQNPNVEMGKTEGYQYINAAQTQGRFYRNGAFVGSVEKPFVYNVGRANRARDFIDRDIYNELRTKYEGIDARTGKPAEGGRYVPMTHVLILDRLRPWMKAIYDHLLTGRGEMPGELPIPDSNGPLVEPALWQQITSDVRTRIENIFNGTEQAAAAEPSATLFGNEADAAAAAKLAAEGDWRVQGGPAPFADEAGHPNPESFTTEQAARAEHERRSVLWAERFHPGPDMWPKELGALVRWWRDNKPPRANDNFAQERVPEWDIRLLADEALPRNVPYREAIQPVEKQIGVTAADKAWREILFNSSGIHMPDREHAPHYITGLRKAIKAAEGVVTPEQLATAKDWLARGEALLKELPKKGEMDDAARKAAYANADRKALGAEVSAANEAARIRYARLLLEAGYDPHRIVGMTGNTQRDVAGALDQLVSELPPEGAPGIPPTPSGTYGIEGDFPIPGEETTRVPFRYRLMELGDLVTSDKPGYPKALQPRNRAQRVTSEAQIADIANRFDPNLALRTESGSHGPQVVDAEGNVLAGNGRAMAMQRMTDAQYAKYADALAKRASEFGLSSDQVKGMDRPVLVREVPMDQATPKLAADLNAETGRMTTVEQARVLADAITPDALDELQVGEKTTLDNALRTQRNKAFVEGLLGLLNKQQADTLLDEHGILNADGVTLISKAILQKVLRDPTGELLSKIVNTGDYQMLRNGIEDAAGQLAKVQAAVDQGRLSESFADTLRAAMGEYESLVAERNRLGTAAERPMTMLSMADPLAADLAWSLASMTSRTEIANFFREFAAAQLGRAVDNVDAGPGMFAGMEAVPQQGAMVKSIQDAINVLNNLRRKRGGQQGLFDPGEPPKPVAEIPQIADPDGTIPARFESTAGTEQLARDVPVVDQDAGVAARMTPSNVLHVKGNPLDPGTYAGAERAGEVVFHGGPENYAKAVQAFYDNSEAAVRLYNGFARQHPDLSSLFEDTAIALDNGHAGGPELLILDSLSADGLRFDAEGRFNGTFDLNAKLEAGKYDQLAGLGKGVTPMRATHEPVDVAAGDAAAFSPTPEGTPPGSGITADMTAERKDVQNAIDSGAHTFVKRGGASDEAARRITGASKGNPQGVVLEVNPPDQATLLRLAQERVDNLRQQVAEQQARVDALPVRPEQPQIVEPIPPEIADLMVDYTNEPLSDTAKTFGFTTAPSNLGQIIDVIESIDAGIPPLGKTMSEGQMQTLRAGLMDWLERRLALEPGMPSGKQLSAAKKSAEDRLRETVIDTPEKFADGLVTALRALEPIVKDDPNGALPGWEGTQYDLGYLRKRDPEGRPLSPRVLSNVSLLEMLSKIAPDLPDELLMGRKQALLPRIQTARLAGFMRELPGSDYVARAIREVERQAAGQPERDLRRALLDRFADETVGLPPEHAHPDRIAAYQQERKQAMGIVGALHDFMALPENASIGGRFRKFRTEYEVGPDRFERIVNDYLTDNGKNDLPEWAQAFKARAGESPSPFFDAWARADNRLRSYFAEQDNGAAKYVTALYDSPRVRALSRQRSGLVQLYHQFRFLLDARWIALEMIEAPTLTLFREGPGALMEALGIKGFDGFKVARSKTASKPMFVGLDDLSKQRENYAWWTATTNPGLNLRYRENYLLALVKHRQMRDFPDVLMRMAQRDPELMQTMKALGDTPADWLERLNNSWELYSALSRKLDPQEARAVYGPRLADGTINQGEYDKLIEAAARQDGYHYVKIPAFEAEIAAAAGNPLMAPALRRLQFLSEQAWNDAAQLIYGQVDRSNIQRLLNHPLLYWPISYQLKATKWLMGLMFDRFMGADTGSLGALTLDRIHAQHQQQYASDPEYRQFFEDNKTLLFIASMMFPITPFDVGVGLSPFTRLAIGTATGALGLDQGDPEGPYRRNIFAVGPGYTYFNLIPRLGYELGKSPNPAAAGAGHLLNTYFPYQVTVGPSASQQVQANQQEYGQLPLPAAQNYQPPAQRYEDTGP